MGPKESTVSLAPFNIPHLQAKIVPAIDHSWVIDPNLASLNFAVLAV